MSRGDAPPGDPCGSSTVTSRNTPTHIRRTWRVDVTTLLHIRRCSEPVYAGSVRGSNPLSSTTFEQVRAYGPHRPYRHWLGALEDKLADCGLMLTDAATVRAQELSTRATDIDHEH